MQDNIMDDVNSIDASALASLSGYLVVPPSNDYLLDNSFFKHYFGSNI